jgi:hypothetical protein
MSIHVAKFTLLVVMGMLPCASVIAQQAPVPPKDAPTSRMFADVEAGNWAYAAIEKLRQKGIVYGYPEGNFIGRRLLTRYEFAVALDRTLRTNKQRQETGPATDSQEMDAEAKEDLERLTGEFANELKGMGETVPAIRRPAMIEVNAKTEWIRLRLFPMGTYTCFGNQPNPLIVAVTYGDASSVDWYLLRDPDVETVQFALKRAVAFGQSLIAHKLRLWLALRTAGYHALIVDNKHDKSNTRMVPATRTQPYGRRSLWP